MNDGIDVPKAVFQQRIQKIRFVDVVGIGAVDQVFPLVGCAQVVNYQNIIDTVFIQPPRDGTADKAGAACNNVHVGLRSDGYCSWSGIFIRM